MSSRPHLDRDFPILNLECHWSLFHRVVPSRDGRAIRCDDLAGSEDRVAGDGFEWVVRRRQLRPPRIAGLWQTVADGEVGATEAGSGTMDPVGTSGAVLGLRGRGRQDRGSPRDGRNHDHQTKELLGMAVLQGSLRSSRIVRIASRSLTEPERMGEGAGLQTDQDRETSQVPDVFAVQEQQLQTLLVAS